MADRVGLLMMAQAGYHPDFALALYGYLERRLGDRLRIGELFSDHPRWRSREERDLRARGAALAIFHSRWQDAAQSPGGLPPELERAQAALERY
jgi:hypothetical protein